MKFLSLDLMRYEVSGEWMIGIFEKCLKRNMRFTIKYVEMVMESLSFREKIY